MIPGIGTSSNVPGTSTNEPAAGTGSSSTGQYVLATSRPSTGNSVQLAAIDNGATNNIPYFVIDLLASTENSGVLVSYPVATQPSTPSKLIGTSPRPSILRKRDYEGYVSSICFDSIKTESPNELSSPACR